MEYTGERFMPELTGEIKHEHLHRYALAQEFVKDKEVLDIASGEGYGAALLSKIARSIIGVDIDEETVEHARGRYGAHSNLEFRVGSCDQIPLPDKSVDVVTSFETIEHHDKHSEMMREIKRVLRPDGLLIISSPNRPVYSEQFNFENPFHIKELDYEELVGLLEQHFHFVRVYGQKLAAGSFVFPLSDTPKDNYTSYASNGEQINRKLYPLKSPIYFVAVCSDLEVENGKVLGSIYIDTHEELLQATHDELSMLRAAYERDVHQSRRMLEELRSSLSFKIVSRVVWPLSGKLLPGLLRAQLKMAMRKVKRRFSQSAHADELEQAANKQEQLRWSLDTNLSQPLIVGKGNFLYLKGWCYHPFRDIKELSVVVDGVPQHIINHSMGLPDVLREEAPRNDHAGRSLTSGFWTTIAFEEISAAKKVHLSLRAQLDDGQQTEAELGKLSLIPFDRKEPVNGFETNDSATSGEPLVAICMTTYNPPLDLLAPQIESLIAQTHRNWVCVINDDCSDEDVFREVKKLAARDSRFRVHRNAKRLGFYRNFERCLNLMPEGADFIAFCDQDDYWFPDKLASCLAAFRPDISMVYSDMEIVTREGEIITRTLYANRKNNYTDLGALFLANTVAGASIVFRPDLLDDLLPFPEPISGMFHDHWVACVALAKGDIGYVDKPLYAYRQHSSNVVGGIASQVSVLTELRSVAYLLRLMSMGATDFGEFLKGIYEIYFSHVVRLTFIAKALRLRIKDIKKDKLNIIERFISFEHSLSALYVEALRNRMLRGSTLGYDLLCLRLEICLRLFKDYCHKHRQHFYDRHLAAGAPAPPAQKTNADAMEGASEVADFIRQKIAPLKLNISPNARRRVNFIISNVNIQYLFAGLLCVFNLARQLKRSGYAVRLVIVDECDYQPSVWKREIAEYDSLRDLFDEVETAYVFDRSNTLEVSSSDAFVAMSWWTAHIAHRACRELKQERFVYLIQDYEPLFFPAGSFYALCEQAYTLPHHAIFSTSILRDYFQQNRIGVFAPGTNHQSDAAPIVIHNAVNSFEVSEEELRSRKRRKLFFYARPEQFNNPRNMFEMGLLAIRESLAEGVFDPQVWEFHGVGAMSQYVDVPLHRGVELKMLPGMSLPKFLKLLPTYDLGLSLMMTPHTSLMPLDMAAAGLVTVTNTFATKTSEKMSEISPNIIAVPPTLDALKAGLIAALAEVDNFEKRMAGTRLNWPSSWDETFNADVMAAIKKYIN